MRDFTVIGDVVNTAAKLQAAARPGEVLVMEETYQSVADQFPDAPRRTLDLKSKSAPVAVRVLAHISAAEYAMRRLSPQLSS